MNVREVSVRDCMTPNPVVVSDDAHASDVFDLMEKHAIQHIPTVRDGKVVGIATERLLRDALPSILTLRDKTARRRALGAIRVRDVTVRDPVTVGPDDLVSEAITKMRRFRGGSLPVIEHGRLVGIVTSGDLLGLLERLLAERSGQTARTFAQGRVPTSR